MIAIPGRRARRASVSDGRARCSQRRCSRRRRATHRHINAAVGSKSDQTVAVRAASTSLRSQWPRRETKYGDRCRHVRDAWPASDVQHESHAAFAHAIALPVGDRRPARDNLAGWRGREQGEGGEAGKEPCFTVCQAGVRGNEARPTGRGRRLGQPRLRSAHARRALSLHHPAGRRGNHRPARLGDLLRRLIGIAAVVVVLLVLWFVARLIRRAGGSP